MRFRILFVFFLSVSALAVDGSATASTTSPPPSTDPCYCTVPVGFYFAGNLQFGKSLAGTCVGSQYRTPSCLEATEINRNFSYTVISMYINKPTDAIPQAFTVPMPASGKCSDVEQITAVTSATPSSFTDWVGNLPVSANAAHETGTTKFNLVPLKPSCFDNLADAHISPQTNVPALSTPTYGPPDGTCGCKFTENGLEVGKTLGSNGPYSTVKPVVTNFVVNADANGLCAAGPDTLRLVETVVAQPNFYSFQTADASTCPANPSILGNGFLPQTPSCPIGETASAVPGAASTYSYNLPVVSTSGATPTCSFAAAPGNPTVTALGPTLVTSAAMGDCVCDLPEMARSGKPAALLTNHDFILDAQSPWCINYYTATGLTVYHIDSRPGAGGNCSGVTVGVTTDPSGTGIGIVRGSSKDNVYARRLALSSPGTNLTISNLSLSTCRDIAAGVQTAFYKDMPPSPASIGMNVLPKSGGGYYFIDVMPPRVQPTGCQWNGYTAPIGQPPQVGQCILTYPQTYAESYQNTSQIIGKIRKSIQQGSDGVYRIAASGPQRAVFLNYVQRTAFANVVLQKTQADCLALDPTTYTKQGYGVISRLPKVGDPVTFSGGMFTSPAPIMNPIAVPVVPTKQPWVPPSP